MKVDKAYILTTDNPISQEYFKDCVQSCERVNLPWEEFRGVTNVSQEVAFNELNIPNIPYNAHTPNGALSMLGHMAIIRKIYELRECAVILEHDVIMLHHPTINIPDEEIVVLGYKLRDISRYDYVSAGIPMGTTPIKAHEGSHAYAITWKTAEIMWNEFLDKGVECDGIDNHYFLEGREFWTDIPLSISNPISALGWVRKSTMWDVASDLNYEFIHSFKKNLR